MSMVLNKSIKNHTEVLITRLAVFYMTAPLTSLLWGCTVGWAPMHERWLCAEGSLWFCV